MKFFENLFSRKSNQSNATFVKTSIDSPTQRKNASPSLDTVPLSTIQKAHLVKKGNAFLKEGKTFMAYKIFSHLKVYEGLMRVSMAYYMQDRIEAAYEAAKQAWGYRDPDTMTISVSEALRMWLHPGERNPAYVAPSAENRRAILSAYQSRS